MRSSLAPLLAVAALAACSQQSRHNPADEQLRAIYSGEWKWRTDQLPDNEDSTRPIADHLARVDAATQDMRLKYWQDVLRRVKAIARASLSAREQVNYDIYRAQIEILIANQQFRDFEMPANSDTTFWTDLGYTARRPFRGLSDYEHWIAQMRDSAALLPRTDGRDARRHEARLHAPAHHHGRARWLDHRGHRPRRPRGACSTPPSRTCRGSRRPKPRRCARRPSRSSATWCSRRTRSCSRFMRSEYVPGMRTTLAAQDLPDGKAYYRAKIREFTTLDMEPGCDPSARGRRGGAPARGDARGDARHGLQGRLSRLPELPAQRPALLRQERRTSC